MHLESRALAEPLVAVLAGVRPLPRVRTHVPTQTRSLEKALLADDTEMRTLVRVLLAVQDDGVAICEPVGETRTLAF